MNRAIHGPQPPPDEPRPPGLTLCALGQDQAWIGSLPELLKYYRKATTIQTPVQCNALSLNDPRLADTSLLYITSSTGPVTQLGGYERRKLGEFLQRGGLIFAEGAVWSIAGFTGTPLEHSDRAASGCLVPLLSPTQPNATGCIAKSFSGGQQQPGVSYIGTSPAFSQPR